MANYITTGLANDGKTAHYHVKYDAALDPAVGQATASALMAACDGDFDLMNGWFANIGQPWSELMTVQIQAAENGTGASWTDLSSPMTLVPGSLPPNTPAPGASVSPWLVRYLVVSEAVEMFMDAQHKDWFGAEWYDFGNEGSAGEGLSRFLAGQFLLLNGQSLDVASGYDIANNWLGSKDRGDYVNHVDGGADMGVTPGCAILFIYYLFTQLGFTINQIVAAGAKSLSGVYRNLTGDRSDPFPYFKQMLDTAFPGTSQITSGNLDDPYPLGSLSFVGVKDTYGRDEVTDVVDAGGGRYLNGCFLALDGFNQQVLGSTLPSAPSIPFAGAGAALAEQGPIPQASNPLVPQRILFPYDITFTSETVGAFPPFGETPVNVASQISLLGATFSASTAFFFTAGRDPYFTNVNASRENVEWLSQDLRVFTATPSLEPFPVSGGPTFTDDSVMGAYDYLRALLTFLNTHYGDPAGPDPFDPGAPILPGQAAAYTGDSSVTPTTRKSGHKHTNYNFALARVRLRGSQGGAGEAHGVRVFFRLWSTQSCDTDWDPSYSYLSQTDATGLPLWPLAPSDAYTMPFFATANAPNFSDPSDLEYGAAGANNHDITINQGDAQWTYFGCFLNLYDPGFLVNGTQVQKLLTGDHHCLVAEIAYPGAPIVNANGVTMSPEISDKLAQRNLQVTHSNNPGSQPTHVIPHTFDTSFSAPLSFTTGALPDELMIEWGDVPAGSTASVYWPDAGVGDVLARSAVMYGSQALSAGPRDTLLCQAGPGVTYIPIPAGSGPGLAGLLTIELPSSVTAGQEFDVVIRRIGTRTVDVPPPIPIVGIRRDPSEHAARVSARASRAAERRTESVIAPARSEDAGVYHDKTLVERYVVGSYQVKVPVSVASALLAPEEDRLAIFKARLAALPEASRWQPVLARYVDLLAARVDGLGGQADQVAPSLDGYTPPLLRAHELGGELFGLVGEVVFDCFGELQGFVLESCSARRAFRAHGSAMRELLLEACRTCMPVEVLADGDRVQRLVVRGH
ncbi:MAG: hypothetical protein JO153_16275 [Solirubrobacterales bacterium]|nr:hypothetical protein [Solirubrobacterales bacterium]MBV9918060.1 hypothetical protein [Solirubrobacterales bacterium]